MSIKQLQERKRDKRHFIDLIYDHPIAYTHICVGEDIMILFCFILLTHTRERSMGWDF